MDPTLEEFHTDLGMLQKLLDLMDSVQALSAEDSSTFERQESPFFKQANRVLELSKASYTGLPILIGTVVLYLGGRFENFIRTEFELLCDRIAKRCDSYGNLPKEMRESIVSMTATVIAEPKKYGHAEQGVKSFVSNLSLMLSDTTKLAEVNSRCLSITEGNMRAEMLDDLFKRIGAKNIWDKIGQQNKVMIHFDTHESGQAKNKAETFLNIFMDKRNKIAHPITQTEWPDTVYVRESIDYFRIVAEAISEVTLIYEIDLSQRVKKGAESEKVTG